VDEFLSGVISAYPERLRSIAAFGSIVSGDADDQSDVNLLVVLSSLKVHELERIAASSRSWLEKKRFAPRYISERNLQASSRYFQIDFLEMRDIHVTLWGEDLLARIEMSPADLRWQIAYEIKSMRLRLKQQFWRLSGDPQRLRWAIANRFSALIHLLRALLLLRRLAAPTVRREIIAAAASHFGIDPRASSALLGLRHPESKYTPALLTQLCEQLMDMIRAVDDLVEEG
jgi:predicted nucleotidyltransferase